MGLVLGNKVTGRVLALVVSLTGPALFAAEPRATATTSPAPVPPRRLIHEYHQPLYELRVMQASPGKLGALHARIRDHQIPIMEQHGLTTLAVFVPAGENPNALVLLPVDLGGVVIGSSHLKSLYLRGVRNRSSYRSQRHRQRYESQTAHLPVWPPASLDWEIRRTTPHILRPLLTTGLDKYTCHSPEPLASSSRSTPSANANIHGRCSAKCSEVLPSTRSIIGVPFSSPGSSGR